MSNSASENFKVYRFESRNRRDSTEVTVIEKVQANYSSYTWPSSPILAYYLWELRNELRGKHILELGAGTALPGILAAKCGAFVTLSDSALLPKTIKDLERTRLENNLRSNQVQIVGLTWGLFTNSILKLGRVDLIIGSDLFYEPIIFEDLIATVAFLIEKNPLAKFLTTYQERSSDWSIEHLLNKWKLECQEIDIRNLGKQSGVDIDDLMKSHTIHLLVISKAST